MAKPPPKPRPDLVQLLPLEEYDFIIVSFSGGKDSVACVLRLLDEGVEPSKIELWHQLIDPPEGPPFFDWPVTPAYCKAFGEALGIPVYFQWREGGFEAELLKHNARSQGVSFETPSGEKIHRPSSERSPIATRRRFPQLAGLETRWCSGKLKIDVASVAVTNQPRFTEKKTLFITGERREESRQRSGYAEKIPYRANAKKRLAHHWRAVLDWPEQQVWEAFDKYKIVPHPAYYLGWGRLSCIACIFGNKNQWASVREIAPDMFAKIAGYEAQFKTETGMTIRKGKTVTEMADAGEEHVSDKPTNWQAVAMGEHFKPEWVLWPERLGTWALPEGAYKKDGGPS